VPTSFLPLTIFREAELYLAKADSKSTFASKALVSLRFIGCKVEKVGKVN